MGALQGHSLLVESPNQMVRRRAGCGRLDFTSRFDANLPTSKRIYGKDRFFQRCSGSPWMGDFRSGAFRTIPPAWVKADKRIWLTWFRRGDLGCSWWMWFERRPQGWLVPQQGRGERRVHTRPLERTGCRRSGRRLPEGAATIVEAKTKSNKRSGERPRLNSPTTEVQEPIRVHKTR